MKAALFGLLAASVYAAPSSDAPVDAPTQVTIEKTGYSGNGCPQGTVSTLLSPDHTVVTFGFDSFQAAIGRGADPAGKQKNCQIHLGLRYPSGFQVSVLTATYHGYVRLDDGVTANFISSYYFSQDASRTAGSRTTIRGPEYASGKSYTKTDNVENSATVWSPCGGNGILNVNNRIALTSLTPQGSGEISNDDATFKFEQKLRVVWRRCNAGDAGPVYRPTAFPTPDDQPSGQYGGQYNAPYPGQYQGQSNAPYPGQYQDQYNGQAPGDGSYTTTTTTNGNGGFGFGGPQPSFGGGYPGYGFPGQDQPVQVFGPGGQQINSGFSSSFTRPVDTIVEEH